MAPEIKKQVRLNPSQLYLANRDAVPYSMQQAMNKRAELVRMANLYRTAGMGDQYSATIDKIQAADEGLLYLQGMQGINELSEFNDPRRLSGVLTMINGGVPVDIQLREDGTLNYLVNGKLTREGLTQEELVSAVRTKFDTDYTTRMAQRAEDEYKSLLKIRETAAEQQLGLQRDLAKAEVTSYYDLEKIVAAAGVRKPGQRQVVNLGDGKLAVIGDDYVDIMGGEGTGAVDENGVAAQSTTRIRLPPL